MSSTITDSLPEEAECMKILQSSGTIYDAIDFNAGIQAKKLNDAIITPFFGKNMHDEDAIVRVLCSHSNRQRFQIAEAFKSMYNKDLRNEFIGIANMTFLEICTNAVVYAAEIHDEIVTDYASKQYAELCRALLFSPVEYDAAEMVSGNKKLIPSIFIEIMVTRKNEQIKKILVAVERQTQGKTLACLLNDSSTGEGFKRFGQTLCDAVRDESFLSNSSIAKSQAEELHNAGVTQWETNEQSFNLILRYIVLSNWCQLRLILKEYELLSHQSTEQAISLAFKDEYLREGLIAIVECAKNIYAYFAKRFKSAEGINKSTMRRIVISRSEIDLMNIKEAYQQLEGKTMEDTVGGKASDEKALYLILRGNNVQ